MHASRTWWGQRFIEALEGFTDPGRLERGRSYARTGRVLDYKLANGRVTARVRGSINPYFGVYKEPLYTTTVALGQISLAEWSQVVETIATRAGFITRLLMGEMPDHIEEALEQLDLHLLPYEERDFKTTCSCPDWSNPCKHVAGLTYCLASDLDEDPFLLFELRGLPRTRLRTELERSPLGRILASELEPHQPDMRTVETYFTRPERQPASTTLSHKEFWTGPKRLPPLELVSRPSVSALLVKRQGDYPRFWPRSTSFIDVMAQIYDRVRAKGVS